MLTNKHRTCFRKKFESKTEVLTPGLLILLLVIPCFDSVKFSGSNLLRCSATETYSKFDYGFKTSSIQIWRNANIKRIV